MPNKPEFGDDSLWHFAIKNYYPKIVNHLYFITRDRFLAEDIAQETFAVAVDKFDQLKNPNKFLPWLSSIALNIAKKQLKLNKLNISVENIDLYSPLFSDTESPVEFINRNETQRLVQNAISELLSDKEQNMIIMRYYLDMKEKDIAKALGVTEGTVKKGLFRARSKLYNNLQDLKEGE